MLSCSGSGMSFPTGIRAPRQGWGTRYDEFGLVPRRRLGLFLVQIPGGKVYPLESKSFCTINQHKFESNHLYQKNFYSTPNHCVIVFLTKLLWG